MGIARRRRTGRDLTVSLVVAVYGVAEYLPDFLASLDAQDYPHERMEVLLVLDGAGDDSPVLCRKWAARTDLRARVIETDNGGQGRARNLGLLQATGDWIGFPDPDDELAPDFISTLLGAHDAGAGMLIGRTLIRQRGATVPHPLDFRFRRGVRSVDVRRSSDVVQLSTHEVLVRGDLARRCRFPEDRVAPTFEDGVYVGRVRVLNPYCLVVPDAVYYYNKRASGDSAVQTAWDRPGRYVEQLVDRYLPFLEETGGAYWAQKTVLYDLGWYFGVVDRGEAPSIPGLAAQHEALMRRLVERLDSEQIRRAPWPHLSAAARARMLLWKGEEAVAVTGAGRIASLYTRVPFTDSPAAAAYWGLVCGYVAHGAEAERAYQSARCVRLTQQARQPRL
ncbi:glycosyltransferase family 2 protein [Actinomyces sp. 594]|uniref:glycosyltransferase family 2 protein n=1 Tax=Actinomyces sp. 594 TaxID=2057793 RepID=UPI001C5915C6|nr:glycosyltransferase family 2 protein [Actinomyces sp. 594]MBW3068919.1 glycosyltransferase family 2 protein [Actinomyces sp. 594]